MDGVREGEGVSSFTWVSWEAIWVCTGRPQTSVRCPWDSCGDGGCCLQRPSFVVIHWLGRSIWETMQHVPGCMAWYAKVSHPRIIPPNEGSPLKPANREQLIEEEHAREIICTFWLWWCIVMTFSYLVTFSYFYDIFVHFILFLVFYFYHVKIIFTFYIFLELFYMIEKNVFKIVCINMFKCGGKGKEKAAEIWTRIEVAVNYRWL